MIWRASLGHAALRSTARGCSRCHVAPVSALGSLTSYAHSRAGQSAAAAAAVDVPELCSLERLSALLKVPLPKLQRQAESIGETIASPQAPMTREAIELLGMELGTTLRLVEVDALPRPRPSAEAKAAMPLRPPVVTLMGHVDHGKTSLLDAFRGSKLASLEAGGITQAISAFMVEPNTPRAITFVDTPGHELFASMRKRGAHLTDIIVLVVAIDAGVQSTTKEAISHAMKLGCPMVVAANKIDTPGAEENLTKVKAQLLENGVVLEEFGGDVPLVAVSATKKLHLDELREQLLLQAEILELHAEDEGPAEGTVLEAMMQKGLGIVATVVVQRGHLRKQDHFVVGDTWGRVKVLKDERGRQVTSAKPTMPVRLVGLRDLPRAGDDLLVVNSEARAKEVSDFRQTRAQLTTEALTQERRGKRRSTTKLIPAVLKADTQGSLEVVRDGLSHFPTNRVELKLIRGTVGPLNEADVDFAHQLGAFLIGFNVPVPAPVETLAHRLQVPVQTHRVIYHLVDGVKSVLEDAIEPVYEDAVTGEAEVLETFTLTLNRKDRKEGMSKYTLVAGSRVTSGEATGKSLVRVKRDDEVIYEGSVVSLKHFKQEVRSLKKGSECGLILRDCSDLQRGDRLSFYEVVARKPSLYEE